MSGRSIAWAGRASESAEMMASRKMVAAVAARMVVTP
jgi:hypothetical protein